MKLIDLLFLAFFLAATGCGVKGNPLPPETPREIGIGRPEYKAVDEELKEADKKKKETPQ